MKNFILNKVFELCKLKNISIQDLIQIADFVPNTVYAWERNESVPSLKSIRRICDIFGISLTTFFQGYNQGELHKKQHRLIMEWRDLSEIEKLALMKIIRIFRKG